MYISSIVASHLARGNARLIITMPFRHGKSEFLSHWTSTWFLEHFPERYVMGLSYGIDLATDFSLKVRTDFRDEDNHHLLSTRLRSDKLKIDRFLTTAGGGYTAAGIGGIITGRGADYLFIDDYIKNAETAMSHSQLDSIWEWYKSTARTRVEPGGSIVVLATRWAKRDLIGRLLEDHSHENWTLINLPALAMHNDPLGRAPGEPLWAERYGLDELDDLRISLGPYWWEAMAQQDPPDSMGGAALGDKLKIIDVADLPHKDHRKPMRVWDLAASDGTGDWTAGPKMEMEKGSGDIYITDMSRAQKSPKGVELMVSTNAVADGAGVSIWMEQEPGSAGVSVIEHYKQDILRGFAFKADKPTGPIEVRAQPLMAGIEAGNVYMIRADWNQALIDELNAFPDGDNDDQVSALSLGYHKLMRGRHQSVVWGRSTKSDESKGIILPFRTTRSSVYGARGRTTGKLTW
jgi:predicted phage terminase large subunit-like protein